MNQIFGKVDEEEIPKALRRGRNNKRNGKKIKKKKNLAKKIIITSILIHRKIKAHLLVITTILKEMIITFLKI